MSTIKVRKEILLKTPTIDDSVQAYDLLNGDRNELINIFSFVRMDCTLLDEQNFIKNLESDIYNLNIFYNYQVRGKLRFYSYSEEENSYEIFYYIGSKYRKRGIAISTLTKFADYVFNELKANKLKIYINTDNENSRIIVHKLGMKFIKIYKNMTFVMVSIMIRTYMKCIQTRALIRYYSKQTI